MTNQFAPSLVKASKSSQQSDPDPDRKFWEEVNGGLMMIVRAIAWRWLKKVLQCRHCKKAL